MILHRMSLTDVLIVQNFVFIYLLIPRYVFCINLVLRRSITPKVVLSVEEYNACDDFKLYAIDIPRDIQSGMLLKVSLHDRIMTLKVPPYVIPGKPQAIFNISRKLHNENGLLTIGQRIIVKAPPPLVVEATASLPSSPSK